MRNILPLLLLAYLIPCQAQAQSITLADNVIGEGKLIRRTTFDGNSLWGYINGGADLYLEYGFENIVVHDIEFRGKPVRFDLYRMKDPNAAYGIFSVYSFACDSTTGPGQFNCGTKWQLQAVKGNYYLSVILSAGTKDEYNYASGIATSLLSTIESVPFEPGAPFLPGIFKIIPGKKKYCRGMLGIENGAPDISGMMRGFQFIDVWYIESIPGEPGGTATVISFKDNDDLNKFAANPDIKESLTKKTFPIKESFSLLVVSGVSASFNPEEILKWFVGISNK